MSQLTSVIHWPYVTSECPSLYLRNTQTQNYHVVHVMCYITLFISSTDNKSWRLADRENKFALVILWTLLSLFLSLSHVILCPTQWFLNVTQYKHGAKDVRHRDWSYSFDVTLFFYSLQICSQAMRKISNPALQKSKSVCHFACKTNYSRPNWCDNRNNFEKKSAF
jgi:hypothetical protein